MSVSYQDILACAQALHASADINEATARTTVGRAYYAAYHECLAWHAALPAPGRVPPETPRGSHTEIAARLSNPDPTVHADSRLASRKRGAKLRALHGLRVLADYEIGAAVTPAQAQDAIQEAQAIVTL